jgi:hypothetical protein
MTLSDGNVESKDDHAEAAESAEEEEDGDGDFGREEDDQVENLAMQTDTELVAAWLSSRPKGMSSLGEGKTHKISLLHVIANSGNLVARPKRPLHLGLKCPGPGRVLDGLVLGTQVCPHSTIISYETAVL